MRQSFESHLDNFKKTRHLKCLESILKYCCEDTADEKDFDESNSNEAFRYQIKNF